jgi:hypothetical protein
LPALHDPCDVAGTGKHSTDCRDHVAGGNVSSVVGEHDPPCGLAEAICSALHPLGTSGQLDVLSVTAVPHEAVQLESEKNDTAGRGHVAPVGAEQEQLQMAGGTSSNADPLKAIEYESPHVGAPASLETSPNATGPVQPGGGAGAQRRFIPHVSR